MRIDSALARTTEAIGNRIEAASAKAEKANREWRRWADSPYQHDFFTYRPFHGNVYSTPESRQSWMDAHYGGKPHPYDELLRNP